VNVPLPSGYFPDVALTGPRFRAAGDLTLDLFHRDGRVDADWLRLSLPEFSLLWRLAAAPGERLSAPQLQAEAWSIACQPHDDGVAAHMARVRAKLAGAGLAHLLRSEGEDCHFIDLPPGGLSPFAAA
jgi:two-component system, OmpR family, response regulator